MANINKVILIGNLGRRVITAKFGEGDLRDAYNDLQAELRHFSHLIAGPSDTGLSAHSPITLQAVAKRLALALKLWNEALAKLQHEFKSALMPRLTSGVRVSAFFTTAKVDGRNLP